VTPEHAEVVDAHKHPAKQIRPLRSKLLASGYDGRHEHQLNEYRLSAEEWEAWKEQAKVSKIEDLGT
jgi:hypothetical protein